MVSVRDPRDAVVSLMQRFNMTYDAAVQCIWKDCNAALACAAVGWPVLQYERRFFACSSAIGLIAEHFALVAKPGEVAAILAALSTEAVRTLSGKLSALPPERLAGGSGFLYDTLTQITNNHIGDGRIGKWRDALDILQGRELTHLFGPFLFGFGYQIS